MMRLDELETESREEAVGRAQHLALEHRLREERVYVSGARYYVAHLPPPGSELVAVLHVSPSGEVTEVAA